jgi:hypothetical protein
VNRRLTACLLSSLALLTPAAFGQLEKHPVYVAPEARNAAIPYWVAFNSITPELAKATADLDWEKIGDNYAPASMPAEFTEAAKLDVDSLRTELLIATRISRCNFECRWEDGVGTLLPHLGKLRSAARILRFDARRAAMNGDTSRAVEDLLAIRRIARHTAAEPITISKLVAFAVDSMACSEIASLSKSGKLTAAQRDQLLADVASTSTDDLFTMSEVFMSERAFALALVGKDKPSAATLRANLATLGDFGDQSDFKQLTDMSDEQLLADVRAFDTVYDAIERAWKLPEPNAALVALMEEISAGKHGVLAIKFTPAFPKMRSSYDKAIAKLGETSQALKNASLAK